MRIFTDSTDKISLLVAILYVEVEGKLKCVFNYTEKHSLLIMFATYLCHELHCSIVTLLCTVIMPPLGKAGYPHYYSPLAHSVTGVQA